MKPPYLISLFVLCSLFCGAFNRIQENQLYTNPELAPGPVNNGYLNTLTFPQQGSGYALNMTNTGSYIQPATASSTQNFSVSISLSSSLSMISSSSLGSASESSSVISYLPYMNVNTNNVLDSSIYFGLWEVTNCFFTYDDVTPSLPYSYTPPADGYIGLGTSTLFSASQSQSRTSGALFSIYYPQNAVELIFGTDMSKAATPTPIAQISPILDSVSLTDWNFLVDSLQIADSTFDLTDVTAAFDVNINGTLMPSSTYDDLTSSLCSAYCSSCDTTDNAQNLTTCDISSISSLPTLTITLSNGDSIPIAPEAYTLSETINGETVTVFNFISDSNSDSWLVIGSQSMSSFYTVFGTTITLYQATPPNEITNLPLSVLLNSNSSIISQAITMASDVESTDSETEDSDSSEVTDSDSIEIPDLSDLQETAEAVQQNAARVHQLEKLVTKVRQATDTSQSFVSILNDVNEGVNTVDSFLDVLSDYSDLGSIGAITGSFLAMFGSGQGSQISAQIGQISQQISAVSQEINDVAQEVANATQLITQMLSIISSNIEEVYDQITLLQAQQTAYFENIINADQSDACFATFSNYEAAILGGMQALKALSNVTHHSLISIYQTNFQDNCDTCAQALQGLLNAFSSESQEDGCNLLSILANGDTTYHQNWQRNIAARGGYFLELINMGITVVSAYESLQTNSSDSWQVVMTANNVSYQAAVQSLQNAIINCYSTYFEDSQSNIQNYLAINSGAGITDITQLIAELYPWKAWVILSLGSNDVSFTNQGQYVTVGLPAGGELTIQAFDFQNQFGLVNNNTEWIWGSAVPTCLSTPTGPYQQFCNSITLITGDLSGVQMGSNLYESAGALYSLSDFSDDPQVEAGVVTYMGTINGGSSFYWPNA